MRFISILLVQLLFISSAVATIRNVPADHATISDAIDAAEDGDTVLVARGLYREDCNFDGKAITVASHFILTNDPIDIDSTIVSGSRSVFRFDNEEDETSRLIGFTLRDGNGSFDLSRTVAGGGIHCLDSSPTLAFLKITNCRAPVGAGIFIQRCSPHISNVQIFGNTASQSGGGIYCSRAGANPVITHSLIYRNGVMVWGEAFGCYMGARPTLINCTLAGYPFEDRIGAGNGIISAYHDNYIRMINCVVYATNLGNLGWDGGADTLEASYCFFYERADNFNLAGGTLMLGEGILEGNPMFANFDEDDLSPSWAEFPTENESKSPLIDGGDPESPEDRDGSRADIGAIPYIRGGILRGTVLRVSDGEPIAGATISEASMIDISTDENGYFEVINHPAGNFDLHVSAPGFNDTALVGLELPQLDTLTLDLRLLNPLFYYSGDTLSTVTRQNDSASISFEIENRGNGRMTYNASVNPAGPAGSRPGTIREAIAIGDLIPPARQEGGAFIEDKYYLPVTPTPYGQGHFLYVFNRHGELTEIIPQPQFDARSGVRCLAWDGEKFWGTPLNDTLYAFTKEGELVTSIPLPRTLQGMPYLAWDSRHSALWMTRITSGDFFSFDPDSLTIIDTVRSLADRKYGLSYYPDDPDGFPLYYLQGADNSHPISYMMKVNPVTEDTMTVAKLDSIARKGLFLTREYDRFNSLVAVSVLDLAQPLLHVIQIEPNNRWATIVPPIGEVAVGESAQLNLSILTDGLVPDIYPGEIHFTHNAPGAELVVPFTVAVTPLSVIGKGLELPASLLLSAFPNPFNSSVTITFGLDKSAPTRLAVYDINGRLVADLLVGRGVSRNAPTTGQHKIVWDAGGVGAGVYFVRLDAGEEVRTEKIVLMR